MAQLTPAYLVVGPIATDDDVDNLRGYALDIATELGAPTTFATHVDYSVTDFTTVFVLGSMTELRDAPTLVLVGEAFVAGMQVLEPQSPQATAECDECSQMQTVRTVVDEYGDLLCAACRGKVTCTWCTEAADTGTALEVALVDETWVPVHVGCVRDALKGSDGDPPLPPPPRRRQTRANLSRSARHPTCTFSQTAKPDPYLNFSLTHIEGK